MMISRKRLNGLIFMPFYSILIPPSINKMENYKQWQILRIIFFSVTAVVSYRQNSIFFLPDGSRTSEFVCLKGYLCYFLFYETEIKFWHFDDWRVTFVDYATFRFFMWKWRHSRHVKWICKLKSQEGFITISCNKVGWWKNKSEMNKNSWNVIHIRKYKP